MKKLLSIFALTLLFNAPLFSQQIAHSIYDTSDELTTHERGKAFAHWFVDQHFADFNAAFDQCKTYGIPIMEMMRSFKKHGKEGEFPEFVQELEYYGKQDSISLASFEKQLLAFNYKVRANWETKMAESKQSLWLVYTALPNQFQIVGKDLRKGIKLKTASLGNETNLIFEKNGFWFKDATKFSTKPISSTLQKQLIIRKDSSEVKFSYTLSTGETWNCILPALKKPKPYIKSFYSNFTKIDENQRIALTWVVWGVDEVTINHNIGRQQPLWQVMLAPESTIDYEITATNSSGTSTKKQHIDVTRTYLTKVTVTYYQHKDSDPKEKGTVVIEKLENIRGEIVATSEVAKDITLTNDGNYYGPFEIAIQPNTILKKDLIHGKIHISMSNNGKDKWSFTPIVVLSYSDGTNNKLLDNGLQTLSDSTQSYSINF
ncbi:MAG: hypothetical protein RLZZ77_1513 [Bacteroidota bacterium]|jgi:hypothetical protein